MRHAVFAVLLAVALALSPEAFAKAGSSKSFGSRGTRTYDRPMERSITPPAPSMPLQQQPTLRPSAPPMAAAPMAPSMPQGGFFQRNPFLAGMLGGVVGAGIGSMLFGHSPALAAASDAAPVASLLGLLLQLALVGGLVWLVVRMIRGGSARQAPLAQTVGGRPMATRTDKEFEPTDADRHAFGALLTGVQKAWSGGDLATLRRMATPEVTMWLAEDLSRNASRGVRNIVDDVHLLKGDVTEAWREDGKEYATAVMTFSARDYTLRADSDTVVEGDPHTPTQSTEAWTFVRAPGGQWLLSAVERE